MPTNPEPSRTSNWQDRRRGVRLNSHVRLAVEWEDANGQTVREEGFTRVVNPAGCLALLPHDLPLDLRVRLTNLSLPASQPVPGTIVWKGRETPDGHEIGFEFSQSQIDFWGLHL
ncbi:MAG: PilZ domain-containing protein [Acidobacteria bacterium]|nr:PilZ domain-containing protein [Acidobacteriota bacterium]MBI3662955.1 PilZ domain-containing protein [Acidobacteriota bacterium]